MVIASSIILGIVCISEVVAAFLMKEKIRCIIKPLCMISLMFLVFSLKVNSYLLYVAIGCGLIGDICLIFKKSSLSFVFGVIAFFIGHLVYIYLMTTCLSYSIKLWQIIALVCFGVVFPFIVYKPLVKYSKQYTILGAIYFYALLLDIFFASLVLFDRNSLGSVLLLLGSLTFLGSDTYLSISKFLLPHKRADFYIMLTYLAAQILLSLGFCLLL
jgi:uncharacterized membrane protein YhhN